MVLLPTSVQRSGAVGTMLLRGDAADSTCVAQYFDRLGRPSYGALWSVPACVPTQQLLLAGPAGSMCLFRLAAGSLRCASGGGQAATAAGPVRGALRAGGN